MILVAGLSPAWQQIMEFDRFVPAEVNRARSVHWCASGKVLNVAIALKHLAAPCEVVTVLGGASGAAIERELGEMEIRSSVIPSAAATRICTTILSAGATTELVENAPAITQVDVEHFRRRFLERAAESEVVVVTGSIPADIEPNIWRELISDCADRTILDVRGPELLEVLEYRPLLVKPNRHELALTLGQSLHTESSVRIAMQELRERGAQWVVVTDGSSAAWVLGPEGQCRAEPLSVPTVNPIGCGDCFTAGLAARLLAGEEMLECIRYAVAAAADNAWQLLPSRLDPARVAKMAHSVQIEPS